MEEALNAAYPKRIIINHLREVAKEAEFFDSCLHDGSVNWGEPEIKAALVELFSSVRIIADAIRKEMEDA